MRPGATIVGRWTILSSGYGSRRHPVARRLIQRPLVLIAVLFLLVGWIVASVIVVFSGVARGQSARRI